MRNEFDKNIWKQRSYWSQDYDNGREPTTEQEAGTRNAETVRDALLGKPETEWNDGTFGDCECDYTEAETNFANVLPEVRDEFGVGYPSANEVQRYYDQTRPLDIQILREDNEDES